MRLASAAGVSVLLLLVGVAAAPLSTWNMQVVWKTDLNVISTPRVAGSSDEVALVYAMEGTQLHLVAVDTQTGNEQWRRPASFGALYLGTEIAPSVVNGYAVYFWPSEQANHAQLVVADPVTGEDVALTESMLFYSLPNDCGDGTSTTVCLMTGGVGSVSPTWQRVDFAPGGQQRMEEVFPPFGAPDNIYDSPGIRPIGPENLMAVNVEGQEYLTVRDPGDQESGELWSISVDATFGIGDEYRYNTRSRTWTFDEDSDIYIGTLDPSGEDVILDFGNMKMAAIERSTGEVLWSEDGATNLCMNSLWIPSSDGLERSSGNGGFDHRYPIPVRCRADGVLESLLPVGWEGDNTTEVSVEGYDPETGGTLWEVVIDEELPYFGVSMTEQPVIRSGDTQILATVDGSPLSIDLLTGDTRLVDDNPTLWCGMNTPYQHNEPYEIDGSSNDVRFSEPLYEWCDSNGNPVDETAPAPTFIPNGISAQAGELMIVAEPDGLVAYRLS